ncbi:MAG TPA: hypothetical protein VE913_21230 [Longimicrobium sp.]|nr:hypothetical protein [Longimicrobium sp.]
MTGKLLALAAALLVAGAPLHAQTDPECVLTYSGPESGREAFVDSVSALSGSLRVAMTDEILGAVRAAGVEEPKGLVVFGMDSTKQTRIYPVDINFPVEALHPIVPSLLERIGALPASGVRCGLTILRLDPAVRAPGSREVTALPRIANRVRLRELIGDWVMGRDGVGRLSTLVSGIVTREGRTVLVRVERTSGNAAMDEFAVQLFRVAKFVPATALGVPVDVLVRFPISAVSW